MNRDLMASVLGLAVLTSVALAYAGRVGDGNGQFRLSDTQVAEQGATDCSPEMAQIFQIQGTPLSEYPKGTLVYRSATWRVEQTRGSNRQVVMVARETFKRRRFESEIICAVRLPQDQYQFESSLTAPVRVVFAASGEDRIRLRRFQSFMGPKGISAVELNPKLVVRPSADFTDFLREAGPAARFVRLGDESFAIQLTRETDDTRTQLVVEYDLVPTR